MAGFSGAFDIYGTIDEIAAAEKNSGSYVSRVIRLRFLSPANVEAIMAERQPAALTLRAVMEEVPSVWDEQASRWPV